MATIKNVRQILPTVAGGQVEVVYDEGDCKYIYPHETSAYAEVHNKSTFNKADWKELCDLVGIMPFGINNTELQVMRILKERGACTLQMLSAVTGMSRTAIQKDAEIFLLKQGFMRIDGKRELTGEGTKALKKIG